MQIRKPYLVFLGDVQIASYAKTGFGVYHWNSYDCLAQFRLPNCKVDLGLPDMTVTAAAAAGARSLLIGIAPVGGRISASWIPTLLTAAESGLDIVSGLHMRLEEVTGLVEAARESGACLVNVRSPPQDLPIGNGIKRTGKRLLTVGTDCALGKKYTALTLVAALCGRGVSADFRATGQTGILISGTGIPIDAVISDFLAGAAESLSPTAASDHWDVIEGQGSLFHPGYAGVTLGLLHGSQPDALVLCHDPSRTHIADAPHIKIPPLSRVAERYIQAAQLTNVNVELVGISLNTSALGSRERKRIIDQTATNLGVPCFDPLRMPAAEIVDRLIRM
jgi:uncharacterized NAD-dependent epimerase/dehydratase family protein